jgi:2-polyprenyl-3-methyl-5-hydroxy-6-metoxy-1,4-benzoquinol methylase
MKPNEYEVLSQVDEEHWFYCGKRAIVRHWINHFVKLDRDDLLIDAGMGTGSWLLEMSASCKVLGIDDHDESLALAVPRVSAVGGSVLKSSLTDVDLPSATAKVVTAMDVLEHIEEDAKALGEMIRLTKPGGLVVVTVPAFQWLWSDWDETLEHRRRYNKPQLLRLFNCSGVRVLRCTYFNSALLVPIALVRWCRRLRPARKSTNRMEHRIPPARLNRFLKALLVHPACSSSFPAPAGVSLLGIIQRV